MSMAELDKRTHSVTTSRVEKRSNYVAKKSTEIGETEDVKRYEERGKSLKNNNYEMNGTKDHDKMHIELSDEEEEEEEEQEGIKPSVDPNEVARRFSQTGKENVTLCKICGKFVYQMEKVIAEKNVFHKSCFRCKECSRKLTVDSYSSHEGDIYCKQHFKLLFQPKVNFDDDAAPKRPRKHEMIIRENIPAELPPDVVRCESKADDILDNLSLDLTNIKSRFESGGEEFKLPSHADMLRLQRCDSVMLRLAKYQSAVAGENENGDVLSSDSEDEDRDPSIVRESKRREKVAFHDMDNLKCQWETGTLGTRDERKEEIKDEVNRIRQRLCLGRSESMRLVYEKACHDSGKAGPRRSDTINLGRDVKAGHIKEKFEKGDVEDKDLILEKVEKIRKEREDDLSVFTEPGTATTARSLFKQIDANVQTLPPIRTNKSPSVERSRSRTFSTQSSVNEGEIVKCSEPAEKEDIQVETTEVSERFKFFENFKEEKKERKRFQITPPREVREDKSPEVEIPRDPNVVRSDDTSDDIPMTDTARRMLHKFKAMENGDDSAPKPSGPKPLKRITPPREFTRQDKDKDSSPEPERDPSIVKSSYKVEDDIVVEADKAKQLREKFEKWEAEMKELEPDRNEEDEYLPQADTAKNLKAKFEAIKEDVLKPKEKPKARVRRFI